MKTTPRHTATEPNPLHPDRLMEHERHAERHKLLAMARMRTLRCECGKIYQVGRDSSLHFRAEQSGTAGPTQRTSA
jgi:hypothetical protein